VLSPAQSSIARIAHNVACTAADPQRPATPSAGRDPAPLARAKAVPLRSRRRSVPLVSVGAPVCYGLRVRVGPLDRSSLAEATAVLAAGCAFDRAADVADEKLFGAAPSGSPRALGAWEGDVLIGVAAVAADRIRVLAVTPGARGRGAGGALLDACVAAAQAGGQTTLRTLDQPGNYLAPGIDERNAEAIGWLERRAWRRHAAIRSNVLIDVRGNPRVSAARAGELAAAAAARGYEVRRARADESGLLAAAAGEFGGAWPFELERALGGDPPAVHVARRDGAYCAFAAHDGNNRGLGWFGPTGTWPAHRGQGLGEALLVACLVDVAVRHARCEVAWIGPRPFYDKVAGIAADRTFIVLSRDLA
jgi:mycothiol synthase